MTIEVKLDASVWDGVEDGTEAMLDEWLVKAGDQVTENQILANVMLVKSSHELTAPQAGVVKELNIAEGSNFTKEQTLLVIE